MKQPVSKFIFSLIDSKKLGFTHSYLCVKWVIFLHILFFCSTLSEFENFLLRERILINVTTYQKLILKILSNLEPLRDSSNTKTLYSSCSCVNWPTRAVKSLIYTRTR
jgi:hypothetical protein